jgi:putative oxidoreductase
MKNPVRRSTQWGIQIILAVVFISAGLAKLSGVESMEKMFGSIGIGQWFRYFVGAVELVSGLLLFSSVYSVIGATLILMTMAGAVLVHLFLIGGNAMPAFILGSLSALFLILKRSEVTSTGREAPGIP